MMITQDEKTLIEAFINSLAETLSSGDVKSIGTYYSEDGILFPNGYSALSKKKIDSAKGRFFQNKKFAIAYIVNEIIIHEEFAFVECTATALSSERNGDNVSTKVTRDLFILRRDDNAWKIYRYLFNNAN